MHYEFAELRFVTAFGREFVRLVCIKIATHLLGKITGETIVGQIKFISGSMNSK